MQVPNGAEILVTDGRKMLLLRNEGDATHPNLRVVVERHQSNPADRAQKSAAAGRGAAFRTGPTSTYEEADFHRLAEIGFARATAEELNARAEAGAVRELVIAADPNTLGELRRHYRGPLRRVLIAEIAKDLVKHPVAEIERIVCAPPHHA